MLMNKINIDALIVVEGKQDVSYLSSYVNAFFITTNGYDLNQEKIYFIIEACKVKKVIVLTDNDEAGEKIRKSLKSQINGVIDVKTSKYFKENAKKFGVAETHIQEIIKSLSPYKTEKEINRYDYHLSSLTIGGYAQDVRDKIIKHYRLMSGGNKSIENQLNILGIKPEDLNKFIYGN